MCSGEDKFGLKPSEIKEPQKGLWHAHEQKSYVPDASSAGRNAYSKRA